MEEMRARKAVNASGSEHNGLAEESDKLSIVIQGGTKPESQSANSGGMMQKYFQSLEGVKDQQFKNQKPKIQRIPIMLRSNEDIKKHYAPRVISIGPLHHGDSKKFKVTEQLKLKLAARFIHENNIQKKDLYKNIVSRIQELKSYYNPEDIKERNFEDHELVWMFLVDGCAILHYIYCHPKTQEFQTKGDDVVFAHQDIFLLENQLPFQLLNLIMENCPLEKRQSLRESINNFIYKNVLQTRAYQPMNEFKDKNKEPPNHLLDLLRSKLIGNWKNERKDHERWCSFRNISELKNAGVRVKSSKESSLEIRFERECFTGKLYLPTLMVDDSMMRKFLNLIAYEMCPDFVNNLDISSYICFIDRLIDSPNDVKVLRDANVLRNELGSDQKVADLFNEIRTAMVPNNEIYHDVIFRIQGHYERPYSTWIAQVYHDYFSSPWTVIGFLAVIFQLVLSFLGTWSAISNKSM